MDFFSKEARSHLNTRGPLHILITNAHLQNRGGTELYIRDLTKHLIQHFGYRITVYSPSLGEVANEIRSVGASVVDDLLKITDTPDIIHGHHTFQTTTAMLAFPDTPTVFFCHGVIPVCEIPPPPSPQLIQYVAVSETAREKLVLTHGIPRKKIAVIPNFVDTKRFTASGVASIALRKALCFSNLMTEDRGLAAIRKVCAKRGISVDAIGISVGETCNSPERVLPNYDLVFARGRAALEAMASGCAVILADVEGMRISTRSESFRELQAKNFGAAAFDAPLTVSNLNKALDLIELSDSRKLTRLVTDEASLARIAERIVRVYSDALEQWHNSDVGYQRDLRSTALRYISHLNASAFTAAQQQIQRWHSDSVRKTQKLHTLESNEILKFALRLDSLISVSTIGRKIRRLKRKLGSSLDSFSEKRLGTKRSVRNEFETALAEVSKQLSDKPLLACVVMGYRNESTIVEAVTSMLNQAGPPVEIVVVHSGGTGIAKILSDASIHVPVIETAERLSPGAARNLGIKATRAPFIGFLAADCIAEPGWNVIRTYHHLHGVKAISCAVTNPYGDKLSAWASYVALNYTRLPGTPAKDAAHFGVSYARSLFEEHGLFREDVVAGEDTEFNNKIRASTEFRWTPSVRNAHRHPRSFRAYFFDQFKRGRRTAAAYRGIDRTLTKFQIAKNIIKRTLPTVRNGWRWMEPEYKLRYLISAPSIPLANTCYVLGALTAGKAEQPKFYRKTSRPRIIGLLVFRNEDQYLEDYLESMSTHVDGIVALDDGSTTDCAKLVENHPLVLKLIRNPIVQPHVWNDALNHRKVIEASWEFDPDWLIAVDADERLEQNFRLIAEWEIERAKKENLRVYFLRMRELWNQPDTYRADGVWGQKRCSRLFEARRDHIFDTRYLHSHWAPLNSLGDGFCARSELTMYHLRMIDESERIKRRKKYEIIDPDCAAQATGYSYLTDESNLRLEQIQPAKMYYPIHQTEYQASSQKKSGGK